MDIRPLDFAAMATLEYDITKYQPVLFAADSMEHLVDSVGAFFAGCDDDTPVRLEGEGARSARAVRRSPLIRRVRPERPGPGSVIESGRPATPRSRPSVKFGWPVGPRPPGIAALWMMSIRTYRP